MALVLFQAHETVKVPTVAAKCGEEHFHSGVVSNDQFFQTLSRLSTSLISKIDQALHGHLQRFRELVEILERHVSFASFDPTKIGLVQVRSLAELLLG